VTYDFAHHQQAWSRPPVDGVGYLDLTSMPDDELVATVARMWRERYDETGWRNRGGRWTGLLTDDLEDKTVLDFGCGVGLEALRLARQGCRVFLADIAASNLAVAERVLRLHGHQPAGILHVAGDAPFFDTPPDPVDVFYANGVLHHTPDAQPILERAHEVLAPDGEARLMLYSDVAWRTHGTNFVRAMDDVGDYADWYDRAKLADLVAGIFDVVLFEYITADSGYCVAHLEPL
jgi:SAM-dependent methyltransferase